MMKKQTLENYSKEMNAFITMNSISKSQGIIPHMKSILDGHNKDI
jgi:hypothetical protein